LSATSTDAINGSQLFATNTAVDDVASQITDVTGKLTHYYSVNDGGTAGGNFNNDGATSAGALAAGIGAVASGGPSTAVGNNAAATGGTTVALGSGATATGGGSGAGMALGTGAKAIVTAGDGSPIAIGPGANASGAAGTVLPGGFTSFEATAIGGSATATGAGGTALGGNTNATGTWSTAVGLASSATADHATAVGVLANASAADALALGNGATAGDAGAVALGSGSVTAAAVGTASTTIAGTTYNFAGTTPASTVSVGAAGAERTITNVAAGRLSATSTDAINGSQLFATNTAVDDVASQITDVTGKLTHYYSVNDGGTAGGNFNNDGATSAGALAAGIGAVASGGPSTAVGNNAAATGGTTVALGSGATATGGGAGAGMALGTNAKAIVTAGDGSPIAIGPGANASGAAGTVLPGGFTSFEATAIGGSATATGAGGTALGGNTNATGTWSTAVGLASSATADHATAVGVLANASAADALALGNGATAGDAGAVALGTGSVTAAAVGTASTTIAGTTYNFAGTTPTSTVSVGAPGAERTITNVAAGRIAATSTDAVNGSQLFATNTSVDTLNTKVDNISTGGGIKYFHATSTLADSQATGTDSTAAGPEAVASVQDGVAVGHGATAGANVGDVALGSGSTTAAAVGTSGATVGGTAYTFAGTTPTSTVSVGAAGAERTITNVAAGRLSNTSTDAVNGSQLFATNQAVDSVTTTVTNINNGAGIKYFHATSTLADSQATGTDSTAAGPEAVASVQDGVAVGHGATAGANVGDVALGSGSTTAAVVATPSTTIAGTSYNFAGATPTSTVSVGAPGAERTITNVAAGRLSATSTDAVNGSQLFATNTAVDSVANEVTTITGKLTHYYSVNDGGTPGANYDNDGATGTNAVAAGVGASATAADAVALGNGATAGDAGAVALGSGSTTAAAVATPSTTIAGTTYNFAGTAPTSTVSVGAPGAERTITNVAAGRIALDSTDAVNGSQLFATNTSVNTLNTKVDNISTGGGIKYFHATSTLADSQATGTDSTAAGPEAVASVQDGVAVGHGATAGANVGDVALGSGSTTAAAVGTASTTIAGTTYNFAGATPTSTVSVGAPGAERTITNVAAGRLSATSTDAVNGSQLFATNTAVDSVASEVTTITGKLTHYYSVNDGGTQGANYDNRGATGTNSLAAGVGASATAANATAFGNGSQALAASTVAFGDTSTVAAVAGTGSIAGGHNSQVLGGTGAVALGEGQTANGDGAVAIGDPNSAIGTGAVAVGADNTATGNGALALGNANTAQGQGSVALGNASSATGAGSLAFGDTATASNAGDVALGSGSVTAAAVGTASTTIAGNTYNFAGTAPTSTVSVGAPGAERTITNVAAGRIAATSTDAVNGSQLFATNTSVNTLNTKVDNISTGGGIKYFHATSTLADSQATGTDSTAAGPEAVASVQDGVAVGHGATAGANVGDVALGSGSTTAAVVATPSTTIAGNTYNFAGTAPTSTVSVGAPGAERTITNVAAGRIAATSTDAVNGSQLFATNSAVNILGTQINNGGIGPVQYSDPNEPTKPNGGIPSFDLTLVGKDSGPVKLHNMDKGVVSSTSTDAINGSQLFGTAQSITNVLGGNSTVNPDGTITGPTFVVQGNNYSTIYDAVGAVNDSLTNINNGGGIKYFHANSTLADSAATGTDSVAVGPTAVASTQDSVAMGHGATASANAGDVALGAGSKTQTAVGTSSASFNNFTLDNFAGANPTSTVSVGDVGAERTITNVAAGRITATSTDAINGSQLYSLASVVDNSINGGAGIKYFHANSTLADSSATGTNSTAIGPASTASASNSISMGNGASASANNAIAIGAGAQATKANSLALGAGSKTLANLSDAAYAPVVGATTAGVATGEVSVGSSGAERRVTNVAAGSAPTDAANVSQLQALSSLSVKYDTDGSGNLTNRITLQGGDKSAPVVIGNVAPGVAGTDAVNVDQLNGAFDSLNGKIKQARREAWQGAAIGIAASSLQFDPRPGKVSAAMGGGMWHEQGALALGLGYTAESGRVRLNARAVTSGDDWGGGIGISFTFN
ncbi:MAG: hypothetical protein ACRC67_22750, partial [Inquilinus sp.]|uniref:hypothetical protein n=1 Tax=Inquilinus sp. TaxID=1932117 RepID=UPI003F32D280